MDFWTSFICTFTVIIYHPSWILLFTIVLGERGSFFPIYCVRYIINPTQENPLKSHIITEVTHLVPVHTDHARAQLMWRQWFLQVTHLKCCSDTLRLSFAPRRDFPPSNEHVHIINPLRRKKSSADLERSMNSPPCNPLHCLWFTAFFTRVKKTRTAVYHLHQPQRGEPTLLSPPAHPLFFSLLNQSVGLWAHPLVNWLSTSGSGWGRRAETSRSPRQKKKKSPNRRFRTRIGEEKRRQDEGKEPDRDRKDAGQRHGKVLAPGSIFFSPPFIYLFIFISCILRETDTMNLCVCFLRRALWRAAELRQLADLRFYFRFLQPIIVPEREIERER